MKHYPVVSNTPAKLPIHSTLSYSFLMYYFNVHGIWLGVFITLFSIYWIICMVEIWHQDRVDIFDDIKDPEDRKKEGPFGQKKSEFQIRLDEIKKKRGY